MATDDDGSVTRLLKDFKGGDPGAVDELWRRYFERLVALARRRLQDRGRPVAADEEDAALSAFDSFHRRARRGDFPKLDDRDDLWVQLVTLTRQKVIDLRRREGAAKRGGGVVVRESELIDDPEAGAGFASFVGQEPDPEFAVIMTEECRRLLDQLGDETLRQIALMKMGLHTHPEIAAHFGRSLAWVNRKLELIRSIWGGAAV